jgi:hypothetical protein
MPMWPARQSTAPHTSVVPALQAIRYFVCSFTLWQFFNVNPSTAVFLPLLKLSKTCADFHQSSPGYLDTPLLPCLVFSEQGIGKRCIRDFWQPSPVILTLYVTWPVQGDGEKCTRDYCQPSPCYLDVSCTSTNTGRKHVGSSHGLCKTIKY